MRADYFSNGQITGIDLAQQQFHPILGSSGSQADPRFVKAVCDQRQPSDIVIDDGSHVPKHVVASFQILFPTLAQGGLYVIEHVQTAFSQISTARFSMATSRRHEAGMTDQNL